MPHIQTTVRILLDAPCARGGQTRPEGEAGPGMSRAAAAGHLRTLEAAGSVGRVAQGRLTRHDLDPAPPGRWTEACKVAPAVGAIPGPKARREAKMDARPDAMFATGIRRRRDALRGASTDPERLVAYPFMAGDAPRGGERYAAFLPGGDGMQVAEPLEAGRGSRIVATFERRREGGAVPRTAFPVEPGGDHCRRAVEHDGPTVPAVAGEGVSDGWVRPAAKLATGRAVRCRKVEMAR